jgi:Flp pilus assembly pilin Flp
MAFSHKQDGQGIIEYILIIVLVILVIIFLYKLLGPAISSFVHNLLENIE